MTQDPSSAPLSLFPLPTVLVPGASLGLRVFEPRYLDLVRDCGRDGGGFGICLVLSGEEAGGVATPAAFGTEALIEDFGTDDTGLLTLRVRGRRRFRVQRTRVRDNGLVVADVDTLVATLRSRVRHGDHFVFMSNGGFDAAPRRFLAALAQDG